MPNPASAVRPLPLVAGLLLLVGFAVSLGLLNTGIFEFAYFPVNMTPLPFAVGRGFTFEQLYMHVARALLLAPALVLLTWAVHGSPDVSAPEPRLWKRAALVVAILAVCFIAYVLFFVLKGRALLDDELTYYQQARLLATGHLAASDLPPGLDLPFTIKTPLGYTGKYLFGTPAIQVLGSLVDYPALLHIPLAGLTLAALYRAVRLVTGDESLGALAVIFLAVSPMFLLTSATAQSQPGALFCVVVAGLGYAEARAGRAWLGAVLAGMAIGFGLAVRPQTMLPVGGVLGSALLVTCVRRRQFGPLVALAAIGAVWLVIIGLYNRALSGSAFTLPWYLHEPREHYGFGPATDTPGSYRHTFLKAAANLGVIAVRFNGWWLGWPVSLLLVWYWIRVGRPRAGLGVWALAGLAVVLFEFFYYSPGVHDTGPIYHYELLVPGAILAANAVLAGLRLHPRLVMVALALHLVLGTGSFLWWETGRLGRLSGFIHDDADRALALVEKPALLLAEVRCSERRHAGWVLSAFPRRYWSDRDPVVTFPRPEKDLLSTYLQRYGGRHCYYYRRNPRTLRPELRKCEDAWQLLVRSQASRFCVALTKTADRLGL